MQVVHLCPTGFRKEPCERLERHKPKGLRVVLRGLGSSNAPRLPGGGGGDVTSLPDAGVGNHPGLPGPGDPKSQVSRETIEAGERLLKELAERDFPQLDILAVWIDGIQLGPYHVICAVGVDATGQKHVLGLREGATENAEVAKALLEDLVRRGLDPKRRRLFVIDGAQALRKAIDQVFGTGTPVQRCRNHKLRNVVGHLPKDQHDQARATLKAAFKLDAKEGMAKIEQYATWLEREWPSAAASLREGLDEMFTINRLGLPSELRRCLGTTNIIDNGHSAMRERVRRVKNWQSGSMALRWTAVAFDAISKGFRRIMGYTHLWMLKAALDQLAKDRDLDPKAVAGYPELAVGPPHLPTTGGTSSTHGYTTNRNEEQHNYQT